MKIRISRIPGWFGAHAIALTERLVLVVPGHENDAALIEHEKVHCRQIREAGGALAFWWRYLTDKEFRLDSELDAYRVQLGWQPHRLWEFARLLATRYRLGITAEHARLMLLEGA